MSAEDRSEGAGTRRAGLSDAKRELLLRRLRGESAAPRSAVPRAPRDRPLPVSFQQERLLFLARLGLGTAYNMAQGLRLRGALDAAALGRALDGVALRHEVLRTVYPEVDGEPVQQVQPPAPVPLEVVDLRALDAASCEAELDRRWKALAEHPFNLTRETPLRAELLRVDEDEHLLLAVLHHIAGDDWSQQLLLAELLTLYRAEASGQTAELAELAVQYGDYAAWQRARLTPDVQAEQLAYWERALDGLATLELPLDRARPPEQTPSGAAVDFRTGPETSAAVTALARAQGVTTATLLLSAYCVLLGRTAGQDDVAVGSPVANRPYSELEPLVGFFVSTVVMRADLSGDPTFAEVLRRVQATTLAAQAHQDLPFERIVQALAPERDLSRNPLFQVLFAMMTEGGPAAAPGSAASGDSDAGELQVLPYAVDSTVTRFDLELNVRAAPEGIAGRFVYHTDLFEAATIERLARRFTALLEAVTAAPGARLSALQRLSGDERRQVVSDWNDTARSFADAPLVPDAFEAWAARTPDATALVFEDESLTYAELDARANRLANLLVASGVGPDVVVALCLERSVELVVALLAVLKAGGAYLPLDPEHPDERLRLVLADAGAALLLATPEVRERLGECGVPCFVLGEDDGQLAAQPASAPSRAGARALDPADLAYVIFTSGSTGRPKGVMSTHGGLRNRLAWMQAAYSLAPDDRVLQKTPYTFDVSVWEFLWPLTEGAQLVVARPDGHRDPGYLLECVEQRGVTTLHFVPSMLRVFLEHLQRGERGGRSEHDVRARAVRRVVCSGEALPGDLRDAFLERFPSVALHNLYGPTEAAIDVTAVTCLPDDRGTPVTIGRPVANTTTYVLDEGLEPVPIGVTGELYLGGVQLARGYLGRPDLTAERFVPNPFAADAHAGVRAASRSAHDSRLYRTGDLARWRADGSLEYLGRTDHQVKLRGYRIELGEIEAVLARHADVRAAVVVTHRASGAADAPELLVGYVVLAPDPASGVVGESEPVLAALRTHLADALPSYMVPDVLMPLDALPTTANGKLDRKALPEPLVARGAETEFVAPESPIEQELAEIWLELLPVERVGLHDSFFSLGGHSLLATRLVARIRSRLDLELPLRTVFDAPTLAGLAGAVLRKLLEEDDEA